MKLGTKRVKELMAISLSDTDVLRLVENRAKVLVYSDLQKYDTLDEALGDHEAFYLLYESKENYGHWCCVFKEGKKVYFFDPYGIFPDEQLEWISTHFKKISGQWFPRLTLLLYESPYEVHYNEHKFQREGAGVNSCGRWCALRLIFRDTDPKMFKRLFHGEDADEIVTILTTEDLRY